jgi:chromosomal replication initiator protein
MLQSGAAEILRAMKEQLLTQLSRPKYELLIKPLRAVGFEPAPRPYQRPAGDPDTGYSPAEPNALDQSGAVINYPSILTLSISNEVLRGWLLDQYGELLSELAGLVVGSSVRVDVLVAAVEPALATPVSGEGQYGPGGPGPAGRSLHQSPWLEEGESDSPDAASGLPAALEYPITYERPALRKPLLNPRYTFDTFVVGASNQFCYSACWQVAQRPGRSYNPLFIYSGVGLGKTHLMHSIGHAVYSRDQRSNVVYVTSEKFTNDFIEHVRTGRMPQFHARYREADILLIDDIQFLSGKPETQVEFFQTFVTLVEAGKQIVISSDRPPRTLKGMEDRLISRFASGLVCDIGDPSLETRMAILQAKAELERVRLPQEVCQFIAERVSSNVRELEGALIRLLAFCDFNHASPSVELAARVLSDIIDTGGLRPQLSLKQIMNVVCEYFNVTETQLLSPNRSKRIALARMVVMYLAREYTNMTLSQIGAELGGRDHSTVSHGANKIARDVLDDPYVEQAVTQISRMLK